MAGVPGRAFVEGHHDLGLERGLDLHRDLRRQKLRAAVEVRTKFASVLSQLSHIGKRETLKAARIGEDRTIPRCNPMQPAKLTNDINSGPQEKMIRVAENY